MKTARRRPRRLSPAVAAVQQQVARVFGAVELVACLKRTDVRAPEEPLLLDLDGATAEGTGRNASDARR